MSASILGFYFDCTYNLALLNSTLEELDAVLLGGDRANLACS